MVSFGHMRLRLRALWPAGLLLPLLTFNQPVASKAPEIYPLSKVKAGQKGYGMTVFQGTTPERFEFEVISVAKNFLPKQDVIIFKSNDPKMTDVGITHGMSGSPMYLDGKVACALAYGWRFTTKTIGGCTPIEYMIADAKLPLRGPEQTSQASADEWKDHDPMTRFAEGRDFDSRKNAPADAWLTRAPLPTVPAEPTPDKDTSGLVRASVPLSISGLGPSAFEKTKEIFAPYGIEPVQGAGGGGDGAGAPTQFELGAPIGVKLAGGDVSMDGTGTVSYVDGSSVIAFGHPMFGMGEAYLPVTSAEIVTIIPSLMSSFKLSYPLRTLGSLTSDRQSSIAADTSKTAETIPVTVSIKMGNGAKTFQADVIRHRFLTPQLVMIVVASAAQLYAPDITDATIMMKSTLALKGYEPLTFTDYIYSVEGASPNAVASARGLRALVPLLFNPYQPVRLDRLDIDVQVTFKADYTEITALRVPKTELPYGEKTYVEAVLRPYGGKEYVEKIPLVIPERLAGSLVKLEVVPGDAARPDVATPDSLDDVIAALRKTYPATTLVTTIYTPDEGLSVDGKALPDLPDSAMDTARMNTTTKRSDSYRTLARTVTPAKRVVIGRQELVVKIADKQ
jgi:hypothetical protein